MQTLIKSEQGIFKEVGVIGYRNPDGSVYENKPIYIRVDADEVNEKGFLPQEESCYDKFSKAIVERLRKQFQDRFGNESGLIEDDELIDDEPAEQKSFTEDEVRTLKKLGFTDDEIENEI